jgi:hypothetical protein
VALVAAWLDFAVAWGTRKMRGFHADAAAEKPRNVLDRAKQGGNKLGLCHPLDYKEGLVL